MWGRVENHTGRKIGKCDISLSLHDWVGGGKIESFTVDALAPPPPEVETFHAPIEQVVHGEQGGEFWTFIARCPRPIRNRSIALVIDGVRASPETQ